MRISICTTAVSGEARLRDFIHALRWNCRPPGEVVIALRGERLDLPDTSFPVRQLELRGTSRWSARNEAAKAASGDLLVFLDSRCLAVPALVKDYAAAAMRRDGAFVGGVIGIPEGTVARGIDFKRFERLGGAGTALVQTGSEPVIRADPAAFSSANFAISAADFAKIGGFPEREGGRRETDAAVGRQLAAAYLPIWQVAGANAYCEEQRKPARTPPQRAESGLVVAQERLAPAPVLHPASAIDTTAHLPVH